MRSLIAALIIAGVPALALAQTHAGHPVKPAAHHHVAKKKSHQAAGSHKAEAAKPAEEEGPPLSADQLAIAHHVYVGEMKCELGASVTITPLKQPGFFQVATKRFRFVMHPVESRTGAVRLEDPQRGAMWLQLGNKSMLMSQKLGQRLADECQSPEQVRYAEYIQKHPLPSFLDGLSGARAQAPAAPAPAAPATAAARP